MTGDGRPEIDLDLVDRLEVCDQCGYKGGFHMLLERVKPAPPNDLHARLKCPSCGQVYDVGLAMSTMGDG